MGKSSAPAQREISAEERRLLDTQSEYLKQIGDIAQKLCKILIKLHL